MKTNKVFKWLYGVFMFLPMLAIGVTCAYVTFNKNAKDSYSGNTNTQEVEYTNISQLSDFVVGDRYNFNSFSIDTGSSSTQLNMTFFVENVSINYSPWNWVNDTVAKIQVYKIANSQSNRVIFYAFNGQNQQLGSTTIVGSENGLDFDFNYLGVLNDSNYTYFSSLFYSKSTASVVNTLDNAFYYAVDQFNDSGFNKVDFVSYFDMFYNNTSIWTTFANTYMNYVLFVSLAFFIPRVLFWFINFAFSLVDGFSNKYKEW